MEKEKYCVMFSSFIFPLYYTLISNLAAIQISFSLLQIKAESLILEGDPKDRICQAADELHFDLVVIGSRGLGKIKR